MNRVRVAFFGSSTDDYSKDIEILFDCLFSIFDEIIVLNGGYQGAMKDVAEKGKFISTLRKKSFFVQGILFDGFKNSPDQSGVNVPNNINDAQISSTSIGNRVQSMIELADIVIALPGKTGTLHEIIQTIETIRYGMDYSKEADNFKRLFIHAKWRKSFESLHHNGNLSLNVYKHILKCYFSFDDFDTQKDKKQILDKLKAIIIKEKVPVKSTNSYVFPIKVIDQKKFLPAKHRLSKIIAEVNRALYGSYFDNKATNKVVGLDLVLREPILRSGKLFKLDSVGTLTYFSALDQFLKKHKSVIENSERTSKWFNLNNLKLTNTHELFYEDHKNDSELDGNKKGVIHDWISCLEENELGKSLYWVSIKLEPYYHISAFLLLDCLVPEHLKTSLEKLLYQFLLEYMLVVTKDEYQSKIVDLEKSKTKTMFSLTTHSLKTHLNTTVIKEKNAFADKLDTHQKLKTDFEKHLGREVDTLFRLTEILSLVDKIDNKQNFIKAAVGAELLSDSILSFNLKEHISNFNRRKNIDREDPGNIKIEANFDLEHFCLPIRIHDLYLGKTLIELFFNTLFENMLVYGKIESNARTLRILSEVSEVSFINQTTDMNVQIDETKLTGNYRLFKKLIEDTNSGYLSIPPVTEHQFKIIIHYGK